ncbi:MAG TPA: penicillin-binding transpeptidase domain-containing protein [Chloroflexota bacterium]|nr:penicillin-binding transpeptidase domain-containing protein [Chloroflexota bacterium]
MQRSIRGLASILLLAFVAISFGLTYWQVVRANDLVYSQHNARLVEEGKNRMRGQILDRNWRVLASSEKTPTGIVRRYADATMAPVTGYFSDKYGATGLEESFSRYLRGDVQSNPVDALTNQLLHRTPTVDDLHLTLDSKIQAVAAQQMGSDRGAIIAMDPRTGAILAMVSTPYFDPNQVDTQMAQLQSDAGKPLYNRATQGLYTPGSVFKIITASAAIDLGLVDLDKKYQCTDDLVVDGFRIVNKNHRGVSTVTYVDDFAYSCNVTFAKTGLGLGTNPLPVGDNLPDPAPWNKSIDESEKRFLDYAHRFGLEAPFPFDLQTSESRVGNLPLSKVELANTAFGQGELLVTPLLMATSVAAIANGGNMPQPYLVSDITDQKGNLVEHRAPAPIRRVISQSSAASMNRLMVSSVQEGYAKPAAIAGIKVGGKTGSAETGPDQKTHSWFIGYAPADNPTVAVAVIMENKGPGSDFATPAGRKVMEAALGK